MYDDSSYHDSTRMAKRISMDGWSLDLLIICSFLVMSIQVKGDTVLPITILESAVPKGAVCLDGSAPAYSYSEGYGNGSDSWIVFLQGGGWCFDMSDCHERSHTYQGSSNLMDSQNTFYSLLDSNCTFNPHFCNWHKVHIYYCDGASFMSDIKDPGNLYFRGARIFNVMMEEMLAKGMQNANQAILSGSSAGGLATMLHCDKFRQLFPNNSRVKCISDSGFFNDGMGVYAKKIRDKWAGLIKTHDLADSLPLTCTSKMNSNLCLFPEYFAGNIQTPLFIIESAFDQRQLTSIVFDDRSNNCIDYNLMYCNSTELQMIKDFRTTFINTLMGLKKSPSRGMFVHSCYLHCTLPFSSETWLSITLANKTIEQAVADWYFNRSSFQEIDVEHVLPQNCTHSISEKRSLAPLPRTGLLISL